MTELDETLEDLSGFAWIPGIGQILDGIRAARQAAASGQLTADATQTLLSLLGNPNGPDLQEALARLVQDVTSPAINRALEHLDPDTVKTVQHLGEMHAFETAEYAIREHTNEAAGLIAETTPHTGGGCQAMTDKEREELSRKNAELNKWSSNRPR